MSFPVICIGSGFLSDYMREEIGDCVQTHDGQEHGREGGRREHWREGGRAGAVLFLSLV